MGSLTQDYCVDDMYHGTAHFLFLMFLTGRTTNRRSLLGQGLHLAPALTDLASKLSPLIQRGLRVEGSHVFVGGFRRRFNRIGLCCPGWDRRVRLQIKVG